MFLVTALTNSKQITALGSRLTDIEEQVIRISISKDFQCKNLNENWYYRRQTKETCLNNTCR